MNCKSLAPKQTQKVESENSSNTPLITHRFDTNKDLFLAQFDCKTDVDDIHAGAALATLVQHPEFSSLNYHVVGGAYGIQEGLYVSPNALFDKAFGSLWSDAHADRNKALNEVLTKVIATLAQGGHIWVAEGGQSDFTAKWIKALQNRKPNLNINQRIHVVQHSDWNEKVATPELLQFVRETTDYHKIADGNVVGNGTPGFVSKTDFKFEDYITATSNLNELWTMSITIANEFNGKEGRYLNKAVAEGALDFSDLSETCYILGIDDIKNAEAFFKRFAE